MIECCHCKPLVAAHIEAFELFCVIKDISTPLLPTYLATYMPTTSSRRSHPHPHPHAVLAILTISRFL